MAEAALKYDEFEDFDDIEPVEIPAGGIATFLTAREGMFADDDDELPAGGIASVKQVADKLAEYGRHEDEYMVHAAEGETVIPMEVFRKNPILKENIYRQMRDMGLEPERYVIGNELNSINPVTGQPEFFIKKLFKKLGKFLKKAIKVVLPIALNFVFPGLGVIASAAIGSGIGGLIQGESFGEALKSAAIGGLTAGVAKGVSGGIGAVKEGGKFGAGFKAGFQAPAGTSAFQAGQSSVYTPTAADLATKGEMLYGKVDFDALQAPPSASGAPGPSTAGAPPSASGVPSGEFTGKPYLLGGTEKVPVSSGEFTGKPYLLGGTEPVTDPTVTQTGVDAGAVVDAASKKVTTTAPSMTAQTAEQFIKDSTVKLPDLSDSFRKLGPGGGDFMEGAREIFMPRNALRNQARSFVENAIQSGELTGVELGTKAFDNVVSEIMKNPGFMRRILPGTIAAMGIGNLVNPSQNPDLPDMSGEGISQALTLLEENPDQYRSFQNLAIRGGGQFSPFEIQPLYNDPLGTTTYQSVADVATGGGMNIEDFPPRIGRISGPGTETSDDIPAMLSDGEFVMTAEAVRGAGNGSREAGMRNMYQMMNQFEAMA